MNTAPKSKPNILIIVVDSLRADHVSCYGYHRETTPNIDRLAAEGCLFETAITAAPFSPASYASLFSNLYPHQHGVNGDTVRVWPNTFTRLAEKLKSKGYYTFGVSNNSFVGPATNAVQGFDVFAEMYRRPWIMHKYSGLVRRTRRYIGNQMAHRLEPHHVRWPEMRNSAKSMRLLQRYVQRTPRPFFGFAILMDPHAPYDRRRRMFSGDSVRVKDFLRTINDGKMWARVMAQRTGLTTPQLRIALDLYDAEIHHADRCIGQLLNWLHERRLLDDTIVIITADHGEAFGEHGVWGHGFTLNDCVTRVPLVIRCPRYWSPGTRSRALVQLHDVHDLCLSVAATGEPALDEHRHCLTQATDGRWTGRDAAFSQFPVQKGTLELMRKLNPDFVANRWDEPMWSMRSRDWRYVEYGDGNTELYDLASDPGEERSVHDRHVDRCKDFARRLAAHREGGNHAPLGQPADADEVDAVVLERLRSLGYIE